MNQPRFDITDRRDVANVFYDRVRDDDVLGPIFDDIAHVDWRTIILLTVCGSPQAEQSRSYDTGRFKVKPAESI